MIRLLYLLIGFTFVLPLKAQDLGRLFTIFKHPDLPGHSDGLGSFVLRSRCELRWHTLSAEPADWMHI